MKLKDIFIVLIIAFVLIGIDKYFSKNSILDSEKETFNKESIIGVWKYDDSYFGDVFLQFESDGTLRTYYNTEGENVETCKWSIDGNKILVSNSSLFSESSPLIVSDFDGSNFSIPPTNYDFTANTGRKSIVVSRLIDETGEPILNYSLFQKETNRDARYDDGNGYVNNEGGNTESYGANTQSESKTCSWCNGTGLCSQCTKTVKKPYSKDGCSTNERNEIKAGYILCNTCNGWGYSRTNVNCPCNGWCYDKECYLSSCMDGWQFCDKCNYNGNGSTLGKCEHCNGSGKE